MRIALHAQHSGLRDTLTECLRAAGHEVAAIDEAAAIARAVEEQSADLAAVDLDEPGAGRHIEALRARFPSTGVLAFSSDARAECVVEALRRGAREVLFKPFGQQALLRALGRAVPPHAQGRDASAHTWIAEDPLSLELLEAARAAAAGGATVLITGEIGTGKTQLARFVQAGGARAAAPFVEVSASDLCGDRGIAQLVSRDAARPDERIIGCLERAHGGTLLVEDVDELDARAEHALLEFLQDGRVRPLGSSRLRHFDVRVISTQRTARGSSAHAAQSAELHTRLGVITLALRPLRERPGDIVPLARRFHAESAPPGRESELDERSCQALRGLALPGNAAELQNLMRQARLVFPDGAIDVERLGAPLGARPAPAGGVHRAATARPNPGVSSAGSPDPSPDLDALNLRELERDAVRRSLDLAGGNRTLAARALGVSTRTLRNKIRAYALR